MLKWATVKPVAHFYSGADMRITCPYCNHVGDEGDFDLSLVGECFCPACKRPFMLAEDDEEGLEDEVD